MFQDFDRSDNALHRRALPGLETLQCFYKFSALRQRMGLCIDFRH